MGISGPFLKRDLQNSNGHQLLLKPNYFFSTRDEHFKHWETFVREFGQKLS